MTVTTELCLSELAWTGAETAFAPGFPALKPDHVTVMHRTPAGVRTVLTRGVHFAAVIAAGTRLITVTPIALPPAPATLVIERTTPATQADVTFLDDVKFSAKVHQDLHDAAAMRSAEDRRNVAAALVTAADLAGASAASAAAAAAHAASALASAAAVGAAVGPITAQRVIGSDVGGTAKQLTPTEAMAFLADAPIVGNPSTAPRKLRDLLKDYVSFGSDDVDIAATPGTATTNRTKLQAIVDDAQARGRRVWSREKQPVVTIDGPIVAALGRSGGVRKDFVFDGNGMTLVPQFAGYGLEFNPVCLSADRDTGDGHAVLSVQGLYFGLSWYDPATVLVPAIGTTTPAVYAGAKAFRLGQHGYNFHPFNYADACFDVMAQGGRDTHAYAIFGEVMHLTFRGLVGRDGGGGLLQSVASAGDSQGEMNFYNCEFTGHSSSPPIEIAAYSPTGPMGGASMAQIAGLHHNGTIVYGMGSLLLGAGYGRLRDIWFNPGCQIDNTGPARNEANVPGLKALLTGNSDLNLLRIDGLYLEGYAGWTGPALHFERQAATTAMRDVKVRGSHFWGVNRTGATGNASAIDVFGGQGIVVADNDFGNFNSGNAATGAYLLANATGGVACDHVQFNGNTTHGPGPNVAGYIAIFANGCDHYQATMNIMQAANLPVEVAPLATPIRDINTGNIRY